MKIADLKSQVAVLSLTRSPLNPLMWAHYGKEHTGIVIAYEADCEFLNSWEYNLIPAESGEVIYTQTKTPFDLTPQAVSTLHKIYLRGSGDARALNVQEHALASRLFLTKHASWVYEEEVRVVKVYDSMFESSTDIQKQRYRGYRNVGGGLLLFDEKVQITGVYLGAKNAMWEAPEASETLQNLGCCVYQLEVDDTSWDLKPKLLERPELTAQLSGDAALSVAKL
nr:MAG TPA: Protein of unknown function (DUF2971) [Caudoviricetes sp.]